MGFDWEVLLRPQIIESLLNGLLVTLLASLLSWIGAVTLGTIIALFRVSGVPVLMAVGRMWVTFFRNIPLLVQLFFWYFGLSALIAPSAFPLLFAENYELKISVLAISLYAGAFMAEVIRAGIEAVPFGQVEAGFAVGLKRSLVVRKIVLPQIGPICLPALTSETVNIVKDTAFLMTIGVADLMAAAQQIESDTFRGFEVMTAVTILYLATSCVIFVAMSLVQRRYTWLSNASHHR
jgi:His/Glu/Gln/Arg/opine family amino acid ABC transporter permease subunit